MGVLGIPVDRRHHVADRVGPGEQQLAAHVREPAAIRDAQSRDEQHRVDVARQDDAVAPAQQRRRVDHDQIGAVPGGLEQARQVERAQEVAGVGGERPCGQEPQRAGLLEQRRLAGQLEGRPHDAVAAARGQVDGGEGVGDRRGPRGDLRHAGLPGHPHDAVRRGAPEIEVHERDDAPAERERGGEVARGRGLALALARARDHEAGCRARHQRQLDAGPQRPVRVGRGRERRVPHHEEAASPAARAHVGDLREQLQPDRVLQVVDARRPPVERVGEEGEQETDDEAQRQAQHAVAHRRRRDPLGLRGAEDDRAARDQRLLCLHAIALVLQRLVEGAPLSAGGLQRGDVRAEPRDRALVLRLVQVAPVVRYAAA